jgi:hypothetical protein
MPERTKHAEPMRGHEGTRDHEAVEQAQEPGLVGDGRRR